MLAGPSRQCIQPFLALQQMALNGQSLLSFNLLVTLQYDKVFLKNGPSLWGYTDEATHLMFCCPYLDSQRSDSGGGGVVTIQQTNRSAAMDEVTCLLPPTMYMRLTET